MDKISELIITAQNNNNKIKFDDISKLDLTEIEYEELLDQLSIFNIEIIEEDENIYENVNIDYFWNFLGKTKKLSREQEVLMFKKYKNGDKLAKNIIFESNICFAVNMARKYYNLIKNNNIEFLDLIQEACIGIIEAMEKFNEEKGYRFTTYSFFMIKKNILKYLSINSHAFKISAQTLRYKKDIDLYREKYVQLYKKEPSVLEIANELNLSYEMTFEILKLNKMSLSLEQSLTSENDEPFLLENTIADKEDEYEKLYSKIYLEQVLEELKQILNVREYEVLCLRFGIGVDRCYKMVELANKYGVSKQMINIIISNSIRKAKSHFCEQKESVYIKKYKR